MTDVLGAWRATFTRRWHRHADLADTCDPIAGHQGRVALLAIMLFPISYEVHRAAILHDMGEAAVGDVPNPVKNRNPDLRAALDRIEGEAMVRLGLPAIDLEADEADQLRLCDKLDAILWARHHRPELLAESGWQADVSEVCGLMWRTGKGHMEPWLRGLAS
jgi:5'-deoxynucleotidase YfbR-like HD superfamily hydrolase